MSERRETPELCRNCYWRLSGCVPECRGSCEYYQPLFGDGEAIPGDRGYDAGRDADAWGRAGFTVFESLEDMTQYYQGSDD